MTKQGIRVLLVDDDEAVHARVRDVLADNRDQPTFLDWVRGDEAGQVLVLKGTYDLYLIAHRLQHGCGLQLLRKAIDSGISAPLIVLGSDDAPDVDLAAQQSGAADYLVKRNLDGPLIRRGLRYALNRARALYRLHADYEEELAFRAGHDALTGLANQMLLLDRLKQAVAAASRKKRRLAVLHIDLDGFKAFNDAQGRLLGDEMLRIVAERLQNCTRLMDTVARLASDEFVMVCTELTSDDDARIIAERVLEVISKPMHIIAGHASFVTCSIGISSYPRDATDPEELIRDAGLAMYRAKDQGRNGYALFTAELNESVSRQLILRNELRQALENDQFHLVYQPQFSVINKQIIGLEALLRWEHPELGSVSPAEFIPVAEDSGLIVSIGEWVLLTACMQQRKWVEQGLPAYRIAVNISARQFARNSLLDMVRSVLQQTGLPPEMLELELTESLLMENAETFIETLRCLRRSGVTLAIDDFGTGYSSLSYLKRFPIDRIKIDRSFVSDVTRDSDDAAIVRAMVVMAESLRLDVVAEGVETKEQFDFLRALGCDVYQGFLFSRPVSVGQVRTLHENTALLDAL